MRLLTANHLSKTYKTDSVEVKALREVSFEIESGSFLAFVGPSGSGKTTLLNLIGCLDKPTSGTISVAGVDVANSNDGKPRLFAAKISALFFKVSI